MTSTTPPTPERTMPHVNVHEVVERLGLPDGIDWGDPVVLSYGECTVTLPRRGPMRMAVDGPSLDAILTLLNPIAAP